MYKLQLNHAYKVNSACVLQVYAIVYITLHFSSELTNTSVC